MTVDMSKAPQSPILKRWNALSSDPANDAAQPAAPSPRELDELARTLEALPLEARFGALCRLAEADCVFRRLAAYRWLAGLHRLDLRYEMRAKRVLCRALDREQGLVRARVKRLMKLC